MRRFPISTASFWRPLLLACSLCFVASCATTRKTAAPSSAPPRPADETVKLVATGYCNCELCCNWKQTHWKTIVAYGPSSGMPTTVGITTTGLERLHGMIAADPSRFPYGTIMDVPGYGLGVVKDGALEHAPDPSQRRGDIEVYFKKHEQVEGFGEKPVHIRVWYPERG